MRPGSGMWILPCTTAAGCGLSAHVVLPHRHADCSVVNIVLVGFSIHASRACVGGRAHWKSALPEMSSCRRIPTRYPPLGSWCACALWHRASFPCACTSDISTSALDGHRSQSQSQTAMLPSREAADHAPSAHAAVQASHFRSSWSCSGLRCFSESGGLSLRAPSWQPSRLRVPHSHTRPALPDSPGGTRTRVK